MLHFRLGEPGVIGNRAYGARGKFGVWASTAISVKRCIANAIPVKRSGIHAVAAKKPAACFAQGFAPIPHRHHEMIPTAVHRFFEITQRNIRCGKSDRSRIDRERR
jgi:hypothetical protein